MNSGQGSAAELDAPIPNGTVLFNAYQIVSEVGGGGMGRVYCARHLNFGDLRAIKVVRKGADTADLEERLTREARCLMRLAHDGVVRCYELLRDDARMYLVMEYVEGPTLQRLLARGPLPDDEVLALAVRLADALAAIHRIGVTHRDVSPANIVVPNGQPETAKIVDFGLADGTVSEGRRGFAGNPVYAAPEQYGLFGGRIGPRADFYSLGLVLAESTVGEPLDTGATVAERRAFRRTQPTLPGYVSLPLRQLIGPLLVPDPGQRAGSLQDAEQHRIGLGAPSSGQPAGVHDGTSRRRVGLFCAAAMVLGLVFGSLAWLWYQTDIAWSRLAGRTAAASRQSPDGGPPTPTAGPTPALFGHPTRPVPVRGSPPRRLSAPGSAAALRATRRETIATAERLSAVAWSPGRNNLEARCRLEAPYRPRWQPGQPVIGIPYAWGQIDGPAEFDAKRRRGLATGSRSYHGVSPCTAGIDCSGFVTYCWGQRGAHAFGTATLSQIADPVAGHLGDSLAPGDALNRAGRHVMLFAGYQPDGRPLIYEAAGSAGRVVRRDDLSWSRLRGYRPIRLRGMQD